MAGKVPQTEIAGEQCGRDHEAEGSGNSTFGGHDAALGQGYRREHGRGVKQQHRGSGHQPRRIGLMGRHRGQDHAIGAHDTGEDDKDAKQRKSYHRRSSKSRTIAARSSGIPSDFSEDVASTSGKAAGWVASEVFTSAMRPSSSLFLIWSALVSTT